ncbi:MAG: 30S ribosomal protein S8 [Cytophagales bacterium]|nr:30S ribosomal protein S8 [Hyphobacterium sp. CCMP332]
MDSIADFLTRVRNAIGANHRILEVPSSKMKVEIAKVLLENGYIQNFKEEGEGYKKVLKMALKYNPVTKRSAITNIERVSTPGLRQYTSVDKMPRVLNGLGIAILSTSKGIMTDKHAVRENLGGEILCRVY